MIVRLNNINKIYRNNEFGLGQTVLDGVCLDISNEDSIAIVGPSGSGKSTLLNIIGTLDKADGGITEIFSKKLETYSENQLAEIRNNKIGFIFQMHHLLPQLSLIENVLLPVLAQKDNKVIKQSKIRAKDLLKFVGLENSLDHYPGQLSVGECQRAAVVRALINQPELLLADEPTGSLDERNADLIGNLLLEIKDEYKIALVVVTHSMKLAGKLKLTYRLSQGKLLNEN